MNKISGKVIIAGGSGFLGQSLARSLLEEDYEVVILGRQEKIYPRRKRKLCGK